MKARKTALLGILCAQAIALSFLENLIPSLPFLPPGAKPGFSNIVTMFTVLTLGLPQAMCITVFKALFALMTRGATAFFMSLAGGVLSTLAMWAATKIKSDPFGLLGASTIAAVCHNAGRGGAHGDGSRARLCAGTADIFAYNRSCYWNGAAHSHAGARKTDAVYNKEVIINHKELKK